MEYGYFERRIKSKDAKIARLQAEVERLTDRAEKAEIDAEFFKGEVKVRNRIPSTNDTASDLYKEVERLRKLNLTLSMERHVPAMRVADKMHKQQAQATDDYMALLGQLGTARNDALEDAVGLISVKIKAIEENEAEYGRVGFLLSSSAANRIKHYKEVIGLLEEM